ncbi:MAG: phosphatidylserine/phosphatidylglycerophosphate/cardiolipin synthase family protein [Myxococcota bacterium]
MRQPVAFGFALAMAFAGCGSCEDVQQEIGERSEQVQEQAARLTEASEGLRNEAERFLDDEDVEDDIEASPPPPTREGNRARLLTNGEAAYLERLRLIDEAEHSIFIQALIFKADVIGGEIADRLIARKEADPDLDIRIIVDAYANIQDYDAQMLYFELLAAGIDIQGYEPLYLEWIDEVDTGDWTAANKRYHEKYFIADGARAVIGGMNIGDEYARIGEDPALIWRDQDIYLEGPVVADVAAAFEENYRSFTRIHDRRPRLLETDAYWRAFRRVHPRLREAVTETLGRERSWSRPEHSPFDEAALRARQVPSSLRENVDVQFIRSRPRLGERWIAAAYQEEIEAAETSIVIQNAYFIPPQDLLASLVEASERGVDVVVITNSKATNDIPLINDAGRLHYEALLSAGARVYEWHADQHDEGTLHSKFAVFDAETAIIGSYNLDPRSLRLNSEGVVVVRDGRLARELHRYVMDHDLALAAPINAAQAEAWADPELFPTPTLPSVPWWNPNFEADRLELFLIAQAGRHL